MELPDWATAVDDPADERLADYRLLDRAAARRHHADDDRFVAEGYVSIDRVIDSGHRLRSVLLIPSRVDRFADRVAAIVTRGDGLPPVYVIEREHVADLVGFDLHRGVLASAERRAHPTIAELAASPAATIAALEGLNDPENVGIIARAARALGVDALLLDSTSTDPYARRTVRVSMGEILHLPVARAADWPHDLATLHDAGFETWAMTPAPDADDLWSLDRPDRLALVLGAEGPGLRRTTVERATRRVRIPISADVDSLNVSHAAAIAFAVACRPRT